MKQYIVDAFASQLFQGNPAAVCVLDHWPEDWLMGKIAQENNLSETAFVVKEDAGYHIRWFTPAYEIDLCGHATLAAAFVIHRFIEPGAEKISFSSQSGPLAVQCAPHRYTLDFPARPAKPIPVLPEFEAVLSVPILALYSSRDIMAVVADEETVRNLSPDFSKMSLLPGDGLIVTAKGASWDFVSRCFYPKSGVLEDPVTGSAHCNLIPYWASRLGKQQLTARQLSPRGGLLFCENQGSRVSIGGDAVLFACCEIFV